MKKTLAVLAVVVGMMVSLAACGNNQLREAAEREKAISLALSTWSELRASEIGFEAEKLKRMMMSSLAQKGLSLKVISVKEAELDQTIRAAYLHEGKMLWAAMKCLNGEPARAQELGDKLRACADKSGTVIASGKQIDRVVAINHLVAAKKQGIRISPQEYKEAGLKPYIVKVEAPVKPPQAAKPHAKASPAKAKLAKAEKKQ